MIILFSITVFLILLYLLYPFWLRYLGPNPSEAGTAGDEIKNVSLILLSYNGRQYLRDKINCLQKELKAFEDYELIIIDDKSTDGSIEWLKALSKVDHLKIFFNQEHKGIPYSMNLGVAVAKFDYLIFCDQRQTLSQNALKKIVAPLKNSRVGAVSGCISRFDKEHHCSYIRMHENFLKIQESRSGSLIGVYGPLYAIKKSCYRAIPENIILDDLYLSLRILKTNQIRILQDCEIIEEGFSVLYDYKRARRYLSGLVQILKDKTIYHELSFKQHIMLLWHKYLRLLLPVFGMIGYIAVGIAATRGWFWTIIFAIASLIIFTALLPEKYLANFKFKNIIRLNIFYLIATFDILFNDSFTTIRNIRETVASEIKSIKYVK